MTASDATNSSQFRLVGVRILPDCAPHIRKNLVEGDWFLFDSGYEIVEGYPKRKEGEDPLLDNFYQLEDHSSSPRINIHAIVGQNGSGKSALIDIILRLINNYACQALGALCDVGDNPKLLGGDLVRVDNVYAELVFEIDGKRCILRQDVSGITMDEKPLRSGTEPNPKVLHDFAYTILLNYSIYAFNTRDYEDENKNISNSSDAKDYVHWLNGLFHKNDGYQTPVVFNPMRTEGNFDINRENDLSRDRLISLFFVDAGDKASPFLTLSGRYRVVKLKTCVKKNGLEQAKDKGNKGYVQVAHTFLVQKEKEKEQDFESVWEELYGGATDSDPDLTAPIAKSLDALSEVWCEHVNGCPGNTGWKLSEDLYHAWAYLLYKTCSILKKHGKFYGEEEWMESWKDDADKETARDNWKRFVPKLLKDQRHMTNKLHQTLNYILLPNKRYAPTNTRDEMKDKKDTGSTAGMKVFKPYKDPKKGLDVPVSDKYKTEDKIYRVPPPIFTTEVVLMDEQKKGEEIPLSGLSSGEKQQAYTMSSILYHMRNIASVSKTLEKKEDEKDKQIAYKHINVILDEIELYFHPEYQRQFVCRLLEDIQTINLGNAGIESINILLATHSPFILSDIPSSKVLRLKDGRPYEGSEQTFGANIHSLFRDSFFIQGAPIGEFAKNKIKEIGTRIKEAKDLAKVERAIALVGEPLIRRQLLRLLDEKKILERKTADELREEISRLEQRIKELEKQKNDDQN